MYEFPMWFGTFHHAEWIECPAVGSDLPARTWGAGGDYLSGGAYEVSAPDAYREYSFAWHDASTIPEMARMNAYRDGAYSKAPGDLFYFHDPLSYAVNILPKRWAQPSLMARTGRPWATGEVPGPGVRGLPLTGAHIKAGTTDPTEPGPGVLFIPVPEGMRMRIAVNQLRISGDGFCVRRINLDGSPGGVVNFSSDVASAVDGDTYRGALVYFKGESNVFGARAVLYPINGSTPTDFKDSSWAWHSGMGHSGCRFVGAPTYMPTNGVAGGMASYAVTLREVGDWIQ